MSSLILPKASRTANKRDAYQCVIDESFGSSKKPRSIQVSNENNEDICVQYQKIRTTSVLFIQHCLIFIFDAIKMFSL
jgi:hypothetical protein